MSVKVRKLYGEVWGIVVHDRGQRWKQSVGSKRAAEAYAAEIQIAMAKGKVGLPGEIPTFREYMHTWLEYVELRRAPRTARRYRGLAEKAAKHIGPKPINTITRGDIRDLLIKEYKHGAATATIELMHAVLSGIFHHALDDGHIEQAPTIRIMGKLDLEKSGEEISPLAAEEMHQALETIDRELVPLFTFLYQTGCRIGEALAITWDDIDLGAGKITINKSAKDQQIRKHTKTKMARTIDMSDTLRQVLVELQRKEKEEGREGRQQVFHKNGRLLSDNTLRRKWSAVCEQIGIGHRRLHDIRHTTASLLLARNVPVTYVAEMLGHSSPKITLDRYAHYIPAESQGLINCL